MRRMMAMAQSSGKQSATTANPTRAHQGIAGERRGASCGESLTAASGTWLTS
jgi:hypothetical protein